MNFIFVQISSVDFSTEMMRDTRQSPYFRRTQIYHGKKHQLTTVITQILVVRGVNGSGRVALYYFFLIRSEPDPIKFG
jgi:tryptophan synthase beta subunit